MRNKPHIWQCHLVHVCVHMYKIQHLRININYLLYFKYSPELISSYRYLCMSCLEWGSFCLILCYFYFLNKFLSRSKFLTLLIKKVLFCTFISECNNNFRDFVSPFIAVTLGRWLSPSLMEQLTQTLINCVINNRNWLHRISVAIKGFIPYDIWSIEGAFLLKFKNTEVYKIENLISRTNKYCIKNGQFYRFTALYSYHKYIVKTGITRRI